MNKHANTRDNPMNKQAKTMKKQANTIDKPLNKHAPRWLHKLPNRWTSPRGRKFLKDPPLAKQAPRCRTSIPSSQRGACLAGGGSFKNLRPRGLVHLLGSLYSRRSFFYCFPFVLHCLSFVLFSIVLFASLLLSPGFVYCFVYWFSWLLHCIVYGAGFFFRGFVYGNGMLV